MAIIINYILPTFTNVLYPIGYENKTNLLCIYIIHIFPKLTKQYIIIYVYTYMIIIIYKIVNSIMVNLSLLHIYTNFF